MWINGKHHEIWLVGYTLHMTCIDKPFSLFSLSPYTAEEVPEIQTAIYVSLNTLTVTWLTTINIADIINVAVIANTERGNEYSVVVGPKATTVEIVVDPAPYNVTVVVFDICGKNYSSERVTVDQLIESSSMTLSGTSTASPVPTFEKSPSPSPFPTLKSMHTSAHLFSFDTTGPSMQCNAAKGRCRLSYVNKTLFFNHRFWGCRCNGYSSSIDYCNFLYDFAYSLYRNRMRI